MKKEVLIILLLLFVSFPAVRSLFLPGGFTSHDLTHHVIRQISMNKLLSEGQFPPRWSGELNNGYGYPVFLFNYPLPALLGEAFHKVGFGYVDSVKAVLFSSMVLSVVGMYLFLSSLLKSRLAAFLGAVFYLYAPIRFLNVYVSAAVGSALALGIVPFVFWALVKLGDQGDKGKKGNWVLWGGIFLALLILAHNVTALIFAPVILIFAWVVGPTASGRAGLRGVKEIGGMILLGLGLSAWFWVPAVLEKQYTRFDLIFGSFYKDQFVSLWQLLRSPWGYGLSHPQNPEAGDMSYQLGLIHIGAMAVFSIWYLVYGRKSRDRTLGIFIVGTFFLSVFLMLKTSLPLWERLPFLPLIQFPLRFSAVSVFAASITAGLLVKYLPFRKLLVFSLLFLVIYANRNHWNINEKYDPGEGYYLGLKTTSTTYGEHLPKWGRLMEKQSPGKLEFVSPTSPRLRGVKGIGEVKVINDQSAQVLVEVESSSAAKLRFNQFYFPGWEIQVDGKPVNFDYLVDGESYGLLVFDIDSGKHRILAEFKNTPIRNVADGISLLSVVIWMSLSFLRKPSQTWRKQESIK